MNRRPAPRSELIMKVVLPVVGVAPFVLAALRQPTVPQRIAHLLVILMMLGAIVLLLHGVFLVFEGFSQSRWRKHWRVGQRVAFQDGNGEERVGEVTAVHPEQRCLHVRVQDAQGAISEENVFAWRARVVE